MNVSPEGKAERRSEEFSVSNWFIEGIEGMSQKTKTMPWVPRETKMHVKAALKELLLARRSMLDRAIERLEEKESSEKKVTQVKVQ